MSDTLFVFHAEWCQPCKAFAPIVEEVARITGVPVLRIDVDKSPALREKYGVQKVPTSVLVNSDLVETDRLVGPQTLDNLYDLVRPF